MARCSQYGFADSIVRTDIVGVEQFQLERIAHPRIRKGQEMHQCRVGAGFLMNAALACLYYSAVAQLLDDDIDVVVVAREPRVRVHVAQAGRSDRHDVCRPVADVRYCVGVGRSVNDVQIRLRELFFGRAGDNANMNAVQLAGDDRID